MIFSFLIMIVTLAATWKIFQKMGRQGWEGIIPIYNTYIQFEMLYGNGCKMFLMLIPFYGIYIGVKFYIDLAKAFNQSAGFGWGLFLLNPIFMCILAFGGAEYADGSQAIVGEDGISKALNSVGKTATAAPVRKDPNAIETLTKLNELREKGILSEEEFNQKKAELLDKI